ncbi:CDP-glycerol glycerophosphotransferase family protein [Enterococcus sp. LJL98]
MEEISLYTQSDFFYIESQETALTNLRISNHSKVTPFEKVSSSCWRISAVHVAKLLIPDQESRVFIYYGETDLEITAERFNIQLMNTLQQIVDKHAIYLYFSLDQKLRFMWHQVPTARAYYLTSKGEFLNESKPILKLTVKTKNIPLSQITLTMRERETNNHFSVLLPIEESIQTESNTYQNTCHYLFENQLLNDNFLHHLRTTSYHLMIVDYWLTIDSTFFPLTPYSFRLGAENDGIIESTLSDQQTKTLFLRSYSTSYGNLSSRMTLLSYEAGEAYFHYEKKTDVSPAKKPIVLIFEYPHKAQENGLVFFNYLMKNDQRFDVYYVIEKEAPDAKNLQAYQEKVIDYKSPEHVHLFFQASYLISSHTINYGIPLITKATEKQRKKCHNFFLQHGITAIKNVDTFYGKNGQPDLINTFIVSSKREAELVEKDMHYPADEVKITGLPRFDRLLEGANLWKTYNTRKKILIMPSWRRGQDHLSDAEFMKTPFYLAFQRLLTNPRLKQFVHEQQVTISFYLHNNFQKYRHLFQAKEVNILDAKNENVQTLMKTHGIMITDYSSVGLDFALQKRTVLYYQFDEPVPEISDTKKADFSLPGPIFHHLSDVLDAIEKKIRWNRLEKVYRKDLKKNLYFYLDTKACERIYVELTRVQDKKISFGI